MILFHNTSYNMASVSEAKVEDTIVDIKDIVDIKGIDKIKLLRALCENAKPTSLNSLIKDSEADLFFDEGAAKSAIFGVWEKVKVSDTDTSAKTDESDDESDDEMEGETKSKTKQKFKFVIKTTAVDKTIKYFNQRPIFCNLSGDKVNASRYNKYIKIARKSKTGTGKAYYSFQEVVSGIDVDM